MIERVREVRARRARLDAEELTLLADIAAVVGDDRGLAEELTPVLRVSTREVERRIDAGRSVAGRMPWLLAAMRAGEVESYGARRVLAVVGPLDDDAARTVDALLAERLADAPETAWQPGNLAQRARRLVEKVDPDGQAERARRARAERKLELAPGEHVMSSLEAQLPAEVASACYSRVDAMARSLRRSGDGRTLDQLRADVTADLLLGRDPGVAPSEAAATVYLHVPVDAALTISDQGCELDGYGPIPAAVAREIMTNSRSVWRAVLCDPGTGEPVDRGRTRRRPSATPEHVTHRGVAPRPATPRHATPRHVTATRAAMTTGDGPPRRPRTRRRPRPAWSGRRRRPAVWAGRRRPGVRPIRSAVRTLAVPGAVAVNIDRRRGCVRVRSHL
ncbi:protein of unknown function (DUF222) [Prauserella aidingensis]|nr:protein of unknown function (DUF222) [Prauserella aidingensis]